MNHTVNSAEINEYTVAFDRLNFTCELLTYLNVLPELSLSGIVCFLLSLTDRTNNSASCLCYFDNLEGNCLLEKLFKLAVLGNACLGSWDEYSCTVGDNDNAALNYR